VLGPTTGNTDTQDSPRPGLGGSHHLPPYSILCTSLRRLHPNGFFSRDSQVGVPKLSRVGVLKLWELISPDCKVRSRQSLRQSCSSRRELSNCMSHSRIWCREEIDSRLLVVGSQIGSLTPAPSFGHNLCFRCLNEQCELILDIYVSRSFQWYKERHKPLSFDPSNHSLTFRESTETPSPKVGVALGVWVFTPSHFLTLPGVCDVTPQLPLGLHLCNAFALTPELLSSWPAPLQLLCLGREPKASVATPPFAPIPWWVAHYTSFLYTMFENNPLFHDF